MSTARAFGAAAGLVLDAGLGEPPEPWHPVAAFGRVMAGLERRYYAPTRLRGAVYTAGGTLVGLAAGAFVHNTALGTSIAVAQRGLAAAAMAVHQPLVRGDLDEARSALPGLVGRDPSRLDECGIARAVVESLAENAVDAVVAPALWAAVAGAPGALGYRAVNTLDAMIGHRNERYAEFGWAAARLDDVAGWLPARATVLLVMGARPGRSVEIVRTVRRDGPGHPSPNAGVAEAAFAAALDLRLGGTNVYGGRAEDRGFLGDGRPPEPGDIVRAVRLLRAVTALLVGGLVAAGAVRTRSSRYRRRTIAAE